jgi:hypothetical protein
VWLAVDPLLVEAGSRGVHHDDVGDHVPALADDLETHPLALLAARRRAYPHPAELELTAKPIWQVRPQGRRAERYVLATL